MKSKERYTRAVKDDITELRERLGSEVGISTRCSSTLKGARVYLQFRVKITDTRWHVLVEKSLHSSEDDGREYEWATAGLVGLIADAFREVERLEKESKAQGVLDHLKGELK